MVQNHAVKTQMHLFRSAVTRSTVVHDTMGYRAFLFFCRRSPYIKRFSEHGGCPISRCCICPVRSYCVSLSFVILVFRVCTLSICPRRPESRESIRRRCAAPLHRNRTFPPSLWPGRELRMSHKHLLFPLGQITRWQRLACRSGISKSHRRMSGLPGTRLPGRR